MENSSSLLLRHRQQNNSVELLKCKVSEHERVKKYFYPRGFRLSVSRTCVIWARGGGDLLVGVCCPVLKILTRFQTKKCNFRHPFSDQTGFQTWPLGRNYVIIT